MTAARSLRILVVDDHEMIRNGLRAALESREGWEVCGEAADGREGVSRAEALKPDIVIMDLTMPGLNGLEATRRICRSVPATQVLILTMHESEQLIHEVLEAGARGYVLKSDAGKTIFEAVEHLAAQRPFFTSRVSELLLKSYRKADGERAAVEVKDPLTSREREAVQLIAEGKSSKEIAAAMGISQKTAETHRTNLMRKLGLHSVSEVVRYAIRNKLIAP